MPFYILISIKCLKRFFFLFLSFFTEGNLDSGVLLLLVWMRRMPVMISVRTAMFIREKKKLPLLWFFFLLNGQPNSSRRNRHTLLVDRLLCLYMHREGISIIQWNKNFFLLCICCTLLHHRNSPQKKIKVSSNIGAVLCQIWFVTFDCRHSRVSRDPSNTDHRVKKYKKKSASPGFSLFSHRIFNSSSPSSFLLTLPPPLSLSGIKRCGCLCVHTAQHIHWQAWAGLPLSIRILYTSD